MSVYGRYGAGEEVEAGGNQSALLQTIAPAVAAVVTDLQDPYKKAEVLRVRIARAKASGVAPAWYIANLEAKLRAAERQLALEQSDIQSTSEWSTLGKVGLATGVAVGGALIILLLSGASRLRRS